MSNEEPKERTIEDIITDKTLSDDEKIFEIAQTFGLPVADRRIYENEVADYKYFIIRRGMLRKTSQSAYVRQIEIVYVFDGEQEISDFDIINTFERIPNFRFVRMEPDEGQVAQTNRYLELNTYIFERAERSFRYVEGNS